MKIAIITGSNRAGATSTYLCHYIAKQLQGSGQEAEVFDLYERPLPLYSPDSSEAAPTVEALKDLLKASDAIVLASPEYHGSMSGVLKNALDYLGSDYFNNKLVLSVCSAGGSVGASCLLHMQAVVRNVHGINCPEWISIGGQMRGFDDAGEPAEEQVRERVKRVVATFVDLASKLAQ